MKSLVPADASLLAQQSLFPQFRHAPLHPNFPDRQQLSPDLKTSYLMNPEFVVCDRIGNALPFDEVFLAKSIAEWEANARYKKIFEKDNFIVFQRIQKEPLRWQQPLQPTN